MPKFLIYLSVMLSLISNNAFANNADKPYTLTLNDVEFDVSSGTIEEYIADYKNIVIPDNFDGVSVASIGIEAFRSNALTSVTIPNSVTKIGDDAFRDNVLTSVTIPNSVTSIGDSAFNYNKIVMVNDLPSNGFIYARNDDGTDNKKTIVSYGGEAKEVTIPNSVTSIGDYAFLDNALTSVTIPNSVTSIGSYAFLNNALTSVIIPNSVTKIGMSAFRSNALTSVTIPDSVTRIGMSAFEKNALTSVSIPNSVTDLDDEAFDEDVITTRI
jgi:sporulation protein YlmC with PRC-barrel domain